jgi:hypothetical protein
MNSNSTLIKRIEKNLEKHPRLDNIVVLFKALLNLSKIGSPLATLISEFIPSRRMLRLEKFAEELADEFKKLEENIDIEFITSDEFAFLFEQCFKAASENYQKEKLDAFKAIIINSATDLDLDSTEKEFFLNLTKQLTVLHINLLLFLNDTHGYIKRRNLRESQIQGRYKDFFPIIFPDVDFDTLKIALDDLNKYGLTQLESGSFGTITMTSGLQLLGDRQTTSFGNKFIKFITL